MDYMLYSQITSLDTQIRWILTFMTKNEKPDFLICDSLDDVNLDDIFSIISESTREELTHFRIENYDCWVDPLCIFKFNSGTHACARNLKDSQERCEYLRTLYVPVKKSLFMKVIDSDANEQVKLSDEEIREISENVLMFLKDKSVVLRAIAQKHSNYIELRNYVGSLFPEIFLSKKEQSITNPNFYNVMYEMRRYICLSIKNNTGNEMLLALDENNDKRPSMHADLCNIEDLIPLGFVSMSDDSLFANNDLLCEMFSDEKYSNDLTVRININLNNCDSEKVPGRLKEIISSSFMKLKIIHKITVHFENGRCDFEIESIPGLEQRISFENTVLYDKCCLPADLKRLSIVNSRIESFLVFPESLNELFLENVTALKYQNLQIHAKCNVNIKNMVGQVYVPHFSEYFLLESRTKAWSGELLNGEDGVINKLLLDNVEIRSLRIKKLGDNRWIDELILKNIIVGREIFLPVYKKVSNLTIIDSTGSFDLYDVANICRPLSLELISGKIEVNRKNENRLIEIKIINAKLLDNAAIIDSVSKLEMTNVTTQSYAKLKLHKNIFHIAFENCSATIMFNGLCNFDEIKFKEAKESNQTDQGLVPAFYFDKEADSTTSRLVMNNIHFNETINLSPDINELRLRQVYVNRDHTFTVNGQPNIVVLRR
ncbi:putative LRR containing protein [Trachipleistophora hominis]|uniref:Putative LRR containing protein n=1 Tax=Trachipleistophora hominis TaxID=72359 RepID=L7JT75_TRAHO|nr:putative LRR containing protein [Trachipleistophora hominis]